MSTARKWMVVALVVVVAGSFAVSASSTLIMGGESGMHGVPQLALVLVLEVAAITGTAIYVATRVKRVRIKAGAVVVGSTAVALVGGVSTYSLLGLVAPLLMVVVVELIADFWHVVTDQAKTTTDQRDNQDDHLRSIVAEPVVDFEDAPHAVHSMGAASGKTVVDQPTIDLPRLDDTRPVVVDDDWWRDQRPTEADYAAVLLNHLPRDGQRLTQEETLEALLVVSPGCTLYRVKKYRKQQSTRPHLEVAS